MTKHGSKSVGAALCVAMAVLQGCGPNGDTAGNGRTESDFQLTGYVSNPVLDEISGIEASTSGAYFVHNDEGDPLIHVIDERGFYLGRILVEEAGNRDWEDLALVRHEDRSWLIAADIGDNQGHYRTARLYFINEPEPGENGRWPEQVRLEHRVELRYPDGARDCEALAWDPASGQLLFLTKRDIPPRLYAIGLDTAMSEESAVLEFLGEVPTLTPPTLEERFRSGKRARWLSQPTGMDISADGSLAAIITYRSLYLFRRDAGESWLQAFHKEPSEIPGPPGDYEEAVTVDDKRAQVLVTTERIPTPVYRLPLR